MARKTIAPVLTALEDEFGEEHSGRELRALKAVARAAENVNQVLQECVSTCPVCGEEDSLSTIDFADDLQRALSRLSSSSRGRR